MLNICIRTLSSESDNWPYRYVKCLSGFYQKNAILWFLQDKFQFSLSSYTALILLFMYIHVYRNVFVMQNYKCQICSKKRLGFQSCKMSIILGTVPILLSLFPPQLSLFLLWCMDLYTKCTIYHVCTKLPFYLEQIIGQCHCCSHVTM